jgi:hypothetical protein
MRNVQQFVVGPAGSEVAAVLVMMVIVAAATTVLAFVTDHPELASGQAPANPCVAAAGGAAAAATAERAAGPPVVVTPVVVADASTGNGTVAVFTDRAGDAAERQSTQLAVEGGTLKPNQCLATSFSGFVRSDGQSIPGSQVSSWAESDNTGTRVTVYIEVSPRYGSVTPAGGYTGNVYLDDVRATGGSVPVYIHVEYPYVWRAAMLCFAAACAGFFWAWLVNLTRQADTPPPDNLFWLYIVLQLAVLVVVPLSVLDAQVLTDPDWSGDVTQYAALAILAGGGALATTPTLRALVDRVVIPLVRKPGSPSGAAATEIPEILPVPALPAISAGSPAGTPAGGDGGSLPAPPAPPKPPIPPAPREPMEM